MKLTISHKESVILSFYKGGGDNRTSFSFITLMAFREIKLRKIKFQDYVFRSDKLKTRSDGFATF